MREKGEEEGESGKEKSDDGGKRGWKESDKNRLQHTLNDLEAGTSRDTREAEHRGSRRNQQIQIGRALFRRLTWRGRKQRVCLVSKQPLKGVGGHWPPS